MDFKKFQEAVAKQFKAMQSGKLYRTGISKDDLWTTYLESFPVGSNPVYKVRTEHDCTCCKQFIWKDEALEGTGITLAERGKYD